MRRAAAFQVTGRPSASAATIPSSSDRERVPSRASRSRQRASSASNFPDSSLIVATVPSQLVLEGVPSQLQAAAEVARLQLGEGPVQPPHGKEGERADQHRTHPHRRQEDREGEAEGAVVHGGGLAGWGQRAASAGSGR
jgi:hypothetical protein